MGWSRVAQSLMAGGMLVSSCDLVTICREAMKFCCAMSLETRNSARLTLHLHCASLTASLSIFAVSSNNGGASGA